MGQTQKERIREYWTENPSATSTEVAEAVDTSPSYARRCKPDELGNPQRDVSAELADTGTTPDPERDMSVTERARQGEQYGDPEGERPVPDGVGPAPDATEHPLSDLVIEDVYDEYECGECGAEVEYLQQTCDECGEGMVWLDGVEA